jgi:hypothetical protein
MVLEIHQNVPVLAPFRKAQSSTPRYRGVETMSFGVLCNCQVANRVRTIYSIPCRNANAR